VSWKRVEARAVNVCQSRPLLEYVEDSEEDNTLRQTWKVKYKQENRLFVMRLLPESVAANLHATSMISQKLVKRAH